MTDQRPDATQRQLDGEATAAGFPRRLAAVRPAFRQVIFPHE